MKICQFIIFMKKINYIHGAIKLENIILIPKSVIEEPNNKDQQPGLDPKNFFYKIYYFDIKFINFSFAKPYKNENDLYNEILSLLQIISNLPSQKNKFSNK